MKLAIICDDLIQKGGAEKVLEALSDIFPTAPIYTSIASDEWLKKFRDKNRTVITSFLQKFPLSKKLNRYYAPLLLNILAFESFDLTDFDVVLSCSSRFAHFVITKPTTKHICYMHSPGRMFWEPFDYFEDESFGFLKPIKFLSKPFLKFPLSYTRVKDFEVSKKVDVFISNSRTTQKRIKKYYGRESEIIYPFIDFDKFKEIAPEAGDFFLIITRLAPWKRVDIAVKACNDLNEKLKIIGVGPDLKRLKSLAGPSIEFLGYGTDKGKIENIRKCRAVIITQKEDFGIVPLEAMACGKPVIAFGQGGATETIVAGITGEFFGDQTFSSLKNLIKDFDSGKYLPDKCKFGVKDFDKSIFEEKIRRVVTI